MKNNTIKLLESIKNNLNENNINDLPYETFSNIEPIESGSNQGNCKKAAVRAFIKDNSEDIYVGLVKTSDDTEITHFFNVKNGKVLDHSYQANHNQILLDKYKGVNYSGPLKSKGFSIDNNFRGDALFRDNLNNVVGCYNYKNKIIFTYNQKEISYNDLLNL